MMAAILNLLMLSAQEDEYKNVHWLVDDQTVTNIVPYFFPNFTKYFIEFMQ